MCTKMNNNINNNKVYRVLCFVLVVYCIKHEALADKEDKSGELDDHEFKHADVNTSCEVLGPPDSHEAMNNREIDSKTSNNREKRSYEFLMGLINNNSKYEVTNVDLPSPTLEHPTTQSAANEALLELMVRIAADPDQWEKVHALLQKIDTDLKTSKKLFSNVETTVRESVSSSSAPLENDAISYKKKNLAISNEIEQTDSDNKEEKRLEQNTDFSNSSSAQMDKMTVLFNGGNTKKLKNQTEKALKTNQWPRFEETEGHLVYKAPDTDVTSKYPWNNKLPTKTYPRNFAYHRVTGHPSYHSNYIDKNPKAYIAVSVIAPKPLKSRPEEEDLLLENELRQLKPWTHKQNLRNMAAIRSKWIIQSDKNANKSAP